MTCKGRSLPKSVALAQELQGLANQRQSKIAIRQWQRSHCFLQVQSICRICHTCTLPLQDLIGVSVYTDLPLSCPYALIVRHTSLSRAVGALYWLERDMVSKWQSPHHLQLSQCKPPMELRQVYHNGIAGQGLIYFLATVEGEAACSWTMVQAASILATAMGGADLKV